MLGKTFRCTLVVKAIRKCKNAVVTTSKWKTYGFVPFSIFSFVIFLPTFSKQLKSKKNLLEKPIDIIIDLARKKHQ